MAESKNDASANRRQLVAKYAAVGNRRVSGWLDKIAIQSIILLDRHQRELGVAGAMCEIGVHRARLFILLHLLSRPDERSLGIDLFEHVGGEVEIAYGAFDRNYLLSTLLRHGCELKRIDLVASDSTSISAVDIRNLTIEPVRIFSVDGGHDAETALSDMRLAAQALAPGGVVLLDDIFNEQWCGVVEAAARFLLLSDHNLIPFFYAGNKMFFASGKEYADMYRSRMANDLVNASKKVETFFGHDVLIAWPTPVSARARVASLVLGEAGLQAFRQSKLMSLLRRGRTRSSSLDGG